MALPPDLSLRIRLAVDQEGTRGHRAVFGAWKLVRMNTVGPFVLRAAAGFASAVLVMGTLVALFSVQPETSQVASNTPPDNPTAPKLVSYAQDGIQSDAHIGQVVVEAYVNEMGEVYDYRFVSGSTNAAGRFYVENLLLFSRFRPARFRGQPVRGLAVLSFSDVSVRG